MKKAKGCPDYGVKFAVFVVATIALSGGCHTNTVKPGWQPLAGEQHFTRRGFEFWWLDGTSSYLTPEIAGEAIDKAYVEWNFYYTSRWGGNPFTMLERLLKVPIQLIPYAEIPGNDEDHVELGIWWWNHNQIDVAMMAPLHEDTWLGIYTSGVEVLKHEWTHVIRGASHD